MGSITPRRTKHGTDENKLTDKQRMFIVEYMSNGFCGTDAAVAAGYSKATANAAAAKLLKHPNISRLLGKLTHKALKEKAIDRRAVLGKLADSLHRNLHDLEDEDGFVVSSLKKIPEHCHCYIDGFEVKQMFNSDGEVIGQTIKVKLSPNAAVQDMLMRHLGAYAADKSEVKHHFDWDSLYGEDTQETDKIEREILDVDSSEPGDD